MVKDLGRIKQMPELKIIDHKEPKKEDIEREEEMRKRLTLNEKQVVLYGSLEEMKNETTWNCFTTYYSNVRVIREKEEGINVITANVLLETSIEGKEYYILQERNSDVANGGKLSLVGGHIDEEDRGIIKGMIREMKEEVLGIMESDEELERRLKNSYKYLTQEEAVNKGNIQINFLGVYVEYSKNLKGTSQEGGIVLVPKSAFEKYIDLYRDRFTDFSLLNIEKFLEYI